MTDADPSLLRIYLNDHLAGATGGLELFRRTAANQAGTPAGAVLTRLTAEVAEDRDALIEVVRSLGALDRLIDRADRQAVELEELRIAAARKGLSR